MFNILPSTKPVILANANNGKCHKYNEYDINPIITKILIDKNLIIKRSLFANHKIKHIPITGKTIRKFEYLISSLKSKILINTKSKPKKTIISLKVIY